eukprot:5568126-Alexandrium_andersonii.AAC.1
MSASLVCSEMCIRDSATTAPPAFAPGGGCGCPGVSSAPKSKSPPQSPVSSRASAVPPGSVVKEKSAEGKAAEAEAVGGGAGAARCSVGGGALGRA